MKKLKIKNWFLSSLHGLLAIAFGIVAIMFPTMTLVALAIYFAFSVLIGGIFLLIASFKIRESDANWSFILFEGILGIVLGIIILLNPQISAAVFVTIIGVWAIVLGLIFLVAYNKKKISEATNNFLLISAILSILFGVLIVLNPFEGTRVVAILIGIYAIAYGIFSIALKTKA